MKKAVAIVSIILTVIIWGVFGITLTHLVKEKNSEYAQAKQESQIEQDSGNDVETQQQDTNFAEQQTQQEIGSESIEQQTEQEIKNDVAQLQSESEDGKQDTEIQTEPEHVLSETQEEKQYVFTDAPEGYFNDALFIGDSRTVGISEYANIKGASFFATTGMSVYDVQKEKIAFSNLGTVTLEELLNAKKYGKIYVMLGVNELGYPRSATVTKYKELITLIQSKQPEAIIFIQANLHVTKKLSEKDKTYNNVNIDALNQEFAKLADNQTLFYIDVNSIFDDGKGNLDEMYSGDGSHVYAKYYKTWGEWIATQAIVR